jgi:hypothetical protein
LGIDDSRRAHCLERCLEHRYQVVAELGSVCQLDVGHASPQALDSVATNV